MQIGSEKAGPWFSFDSIFTSRQWSPTASKFHPLKKLKGAFGIVS
jgi:hypothetical protein